MCHRVERLRIKENRTKFIQMALDRLDRLRQREQFRSVERRSILRVFYSLRKQAENPPSTRTEGPRRKTAELCGVSPVTAQRLVTSCNKMIQSGTGENNEFENFINTTNKGAKNGKKITIVPDNCGLFFEIRDFMKRKRSNIPDMCP